MNKLSNYEGQASIPARLKVSELSSTSSVQTFERSREVGERNGERAGL